MRILYLSVYDCKDFSFFRNGLRCDFSSLGAETLGSLAVCKACGIDAHIELCSEHSTARSKCAYACIGY